MSDFTIKYEKVKSPLMTMGCEVDVDSLEGKQTHENIVLEINRSKLNENDKLRTMRGMNNVIKVCEAYHDVITNIEILFNQLAMLQVNVGDQKREPLVISVDVSNLSPTKEYTWWEYFGLDYYFGY